MKAFVVSLLSGALLLPATATSLSGQVRVELDGWWRSDARSGADARVTYEEGYRPRGGRVSVDTYRRPHRPNRSRRARGYAVDHRRNVNWVPANWNRVRFHNVRGHRRGGRHGRVSRAGYVPDLFGLVGRRTYRRLERHADRIGAYGALNARWVRLDRGARVLQVRAGRVPLAELVDYDRDPRVEEVWLNRPYRR